MKVALCVRLMRRRPWWDRVAVQDASRDPRYEEGIRLFNAHDWFECHEVLEDLWRDDPSPGRTFYQGLIMAAVALEHWRRGNPRGARSQWEQGRGFLTAYPDHHARLDLRGFIAAMDDLMTPIMRHDDASWRDATERPVLDERAVPKLRLDP